MSQEKLVYTTIQRTQQKKCFFPIKPSRVEKQFIFQRAPLQQILSCLDKESFSSIEESSMQVFRDVTFVEEPLNSLFGHIPDYQIAVGYMVGIVLRLRSTAISRLSDRVDTCFMT